MKNFAKSFILTVLGVTTMVLLISLLLGNFHFKESSLLPWLGIALFYASVITLTNMLFFSALNYKFDWETQAKTRLLIGGIGMTIVNIIAYAFCRFVVGVYFLERYSASDFFKHESIGQYIFPIMLAFIIALGFHVFHFYKTIQNQKIRHQKIIASRAESQFEALKNQLDPHFLFNNLNVLTALIDENPEKAQDFTASLSEVYRYVLKQSNQKMVSLADEMAFADIYIDLIQQRFGENIQLKTQSGLCHQGIQIVPLSLQLLLENAVKHNAISTENPLIIQITLTADYLSVKNNLSFKSRINKKSGLGLKNMRHRYALLTKRPVKIYKSETHFIVKIPVFKDKKIPAHGK